MRTNIYTHDPDTGEPTLAGWYDPENSAAHYAEDTWWDGHNMVSTATGSQWNHEGLHLTRGGRWVLRRWSQWQGSNPGDCFLTPTQAGDWLLRNHHDAAYTEHFGPLQAESGPDPDALAALVALDGYADRCGMSRADAIRQLLAIARASEAGMAGVTP